MSEGSHNDSSSPMPCSDYDDDGDSLAPPLQYQQTRDVPGATGGLASCGEVSASAAAGAGARTEQLLRRANRCIDKSLQDQINTDDAAKLWTLVDRLTQLGAPDTYRAWLASKGLDGCETALSANESSELGDLKVGSLPYGSALPPFAFQSSTLPSSPLTAAAAASSSLSSPSFLYPRSWFELDDTLRALCQQLLCLLTGEEGERSTSELYLIPYRLYRRVVPVLYAWLVDWPFMCRNPRHWVKVSNCFSVVCQARPHHSTDRVDFTLPWRPLLELILGLVSESRASRATRVFNHVVNTVGGETLNLCQLASCHFGAEALEGLWDYCAPHFSRDTDEAAAYLCLFCNMLPVHHLEVNSHADLAAMMGSDAEEEQEAGKKASSLQAALPLTERIVEFLFKDAYLWQQHRALWMTCAFKVVARMHIINVGAVDMDRYAEPLFTALLQSLRLPIGDATTAPKLRERFGSPYAALSVFGVVHNDCLSAQSCVVNMLSTDTQSSLWNQLRRCLHATSVFVRPGTSAMSVAKTVLIFYGYLVSNVHFRVRNQRNYERRLAKDRVWFQQQQEQHGRGGGTFHAQPRRYRSIPSSHLWTQDTIDIFVELLAPALLPAMHFRWSDSARVVGLLVSLSPRLMLPELVKYTDAGLNSPTHVDDQRASALHLLNRTIYAFLACDATYMDFTAYVARIIPVVVTWMSASAVALSHSVAQFLFTVSSALSLRELLGEEGELEVAGTFFKHCLELCAHCKSNELQSTFFSNIRYLLLTGLSADAFERAADVVLRDAEQQDSPLAGTYLVSIIGVRAPARVMQLAKRVAIPVLLQSNSNTDAACKRATQLLCACVLGAGREMFPDAAVVAKCIYKLSSHITSASRLADAAAVYAALHKALLDWRCTEVRPVRSGSSKHHSDDGNGDNTVATAVITRTQSAQGTTNAAGVLAVSAARERRGRALGFCRATDVELVWDKPTEEHTAFLLDLCDDCVEDVIYAVQHITSVRAHRGPGGLRDLVPSTLGNTKRAMTEGGQTKDREEEEEATAAAATSTCVALKGEEDVASESAEPFTPHSVLCGIASWLLSICMINRRFYLQQNMGSSSAEEGEVVMVDDVSIPAVLHDGSVTEEKLQVTFCPWQDKGALRSTLRIPLPSGRTGPRYSHDELFDFVLSHMLGRFSRGGDELHGIFGPQVDSVIDTSVLTRHAQPRHSGALRGSRAERAGDARGLELTLCLLLQLNGSGRGCEEGTSHLPREAGPRVFEGNFCEPRSHVDLFPATYWAYKAAQLHMSHWRQLPVRGSRVRAETLMNIMHVLAFSTHSNIAHMAFSTLASRISFIHPRLRHLLALAHTRALTTLAVLWLDRRSVPAGLTVAGESGMGAMHGATPCCSGSSYTACSEEALSFLKALQDMSVGPTTSQMSFAAATGAAAGTRAEGEEEPTGEMALELAGVEEDMTDFDNGEEDEEEEEGMAAAMNEISSGGDLPTSAATTTESASANQPRECLTCGLALQVFFLNGMECQHAPRSMLQIVRLLLYYPDALVSRLAKTTIKRAHRQVQVLALPSLSSTQATVVAEELFITAQQLSRSSPMRAVSCMRVALALYSPPGQSMPSTRLVQALMRMSMKPFVRLQQLAIEALLTALGPVVSATLSSSSMERDVLMRTGPMDTQLLPDGGSEARQKQIQFFKRRHGQIMSLYPHARLAHTCQMFIARSIVVRTTTDENALHFEDDFPVELAEEERVRRHRYTHTDAAAASFSSCCLNTPGVAQAPASRAEFVSMLRHAAGCGALDNGTLKDTWAWVTLQHREELLRGDDSGAGDNNTASGGSGGDRPIALWEVLGLALGAKACVKLYTAVIAAQLAEVQALSARVDAESRESSRGLFSALLEMCVALVAVTRRDRLLISTSGTDDSAGPEAGKDALGEVEAAELRATALQACFSSILHTCSVHVAHEVVRVSVVACSSLAPHVTADEAWQLYAELFAALGTGGASGSISGSGSDEKKGTTITTTFTTTSSPTGLSSASSQEKSRVLALILQLLYAWSFEINGALLPRLTREIDRNQRVFFMSSTTQCRRFAASVVRQLMRMSLTDSAVIAACSDNISRVASLAVGMLNYVTFEGSNAIICEVAQPTQAQQASSEEGGSHRQQQQQQQLKSGNGANITGTAAAAGVLTTGTTNVDVAAATNRLDSATTSDTDELAASGSATGAAAASAFTGYTASGGGGIDTQHHHNIPLRLGAYAPWSATPALCAMPSAPQPPHLVAPETTPQPTPLLQSHGANASMVTASPPSLFPPPLTISPAKQQQQQQTLPQSTLNTIKTIALCWYNPPSLLLARHALEVVMFLARALDIVLPEVDDLADIVTSTMYSFAFTRLPKPVVQEVVGCVSDILQNRLTFGTSRRAKVALTQMLRLLIFCNLHRIGKFAMMTRVAEAALASMEHGDGRLRSEGKLLFSVLAKVASVEQTHALVRIYEKELCLLSTATTETPSPPPPPLPAASVDANTAALATAAGALLTEAAAGELASARRRRKTALLLALCSILLADPGTVPVYGPKLMEKLVPYSWEGATEASRAVKRTFEEWWRSHREGWEVEFKPHFTPAQIDAMSSLLTAPSYYA